MYFKDDDRYFKHPLPVQIRLTHVRVECAIILISMACQRSLILDYDVQVTAGCVTRWRPILETDHLASNYKMPN